MHAAQKQPSVAMVSQMQILQREKLDKLHFERHNSGPTFSLFLLFQGTLQTKRFGYNQILLGVSTPWSYFVFRWSWQSCIVWGMFQDKNEVAPNFENLLILWTYYVGWVWERYQPNYCNSFTFVGKGAKKKDKCESCIILYALHTLFLTNQNVSIIICTLF